MTIVSGDAYIKQMEEELKRLLPYKDTHYFEIGKILCVAKEHLQGHFYPWATKILQKSDQMVNIYIKVYRRFGHQPTRFKHLSLWILYELVDPVFTEEFIDQVATGRVGASKSFIRETKNYLSSNKQVAVKKSSTPTQVTKVESQPSEMKEMMKQLTLMQEQIQELSLTQSPGIHDIPAAMQIEIGTLRQQVEALTKERDQLRKDLERRQADVEVQEILRKGLEEELAEIIKKKDGILSDFTEMTKCITLFQEAYNHIMEHHRTRVLDPGILEKSLVE